MAKPSRKRQRATFHVRFPVQKAVVDRPVVNTLRWWNSHYKSMHEWEDGRVEVKFDRRVKGYDDGRELLDFACPYCDRRLYYSPNAVHGVKGNVVCAFCRKKFGINPNGQIYVVQPVSTKVATTTNLKEKVLKWAAADVDHLDTYVHASASGDNGVDIDLDYYEYDDPAIQDKGMLELVRLLDQSGFDYRRLS
jgi:hypothetical protein